MRHIVRSGDGALPCKDSNYYFLLHFPPSCAKCTGLGFYHFKQNPIVDMIFFFFPNIWSHKLNTNPGNPRVFAPLRVIFPSALGKLHKKTSIGTKTFFIFFLLGKKGPKLVVNLVARPNSKPLQKEKKNFSK